MEKFTNININGDDKTFIYLISYEPIDDMEYDLDSFSLGVKVETDKISLIGEDCNATNINNSWMYGGYTEGLNTAYLPDTYHLAKLKIYFPKFSVDTYKSVKYALNVYTFIRGDKINLGSYIFSRADALANKIINRGEQTYCENIEYKIIDPYYLIYSDKWKDFRTNICGEYTYDNIHTINNEYPTLYFALYPINEDRSNKYITSTGYNGGQNSIKADDNEYLSLNITPYYDGNDTVEIHAKVKYNSEYSKLSEYIEETYGINIFNKQKPITCDLSICDKNDVYIYETLPIYNDDELNNIIFDKSYIHFDNWVGFHEGIFITCILNIIEGDKEISIRSNQIPLNAELFKYFVGENLLNNIDKKIIDDMKININAVNKIVNNIVHMDGLSDTKSNLIQPVFFRSYNASNIIIHPSVTENICINLDVYKSKVDTFIIQINNKTFVESGRTTAGVIFKIVGSKLNKEVDSGTYFILNEIGDVVTSGKYIYEY